MKTFEEQFTAWIDDCLPAHEHAAFERTLAARPDADLLRAEKRAAGRLGQLMRENLPAPALSNPDFFNQGIMERIAAEGRAAAATPRRSWWQWDWTPMRLLAAGATCLLMALAGTRALIPTGGNGGTTPPAPVTVVQNAPLAVPETAAPAPVEAPRGPGSRNDGMEARNNVQPPPVPVEPGAPPTPSVIATPMHFDEADADVIWLDGSDYLPNLDGTVAPSPAPAAAPQR